MTSELLTRSLAALAGNAIVVFARLVTAVRAEWDGVEPSPTQRIYYANHVSHGDFVLIWAVLPPRLRALTRPVAAAEYWLNNGLKRFIGTAVFRSVLIERESNQRKADPVGQMCEALDAGDSLILFPEGTRNTGDANLLPFKSGLYHLAQARSDIDLVPVWIDNLNRVLPKGEVVPIPLICTVRLGTALRLMAGESKADFMLRARTALSDLSTTDTGDIKA